MKLARLLATWRTFRRIAVALERIAATQEERLAFDKAQVAPRKKPKLAQVFVPSTEEMNEIYEEERYGPR